MLVDTLNVLKKVENILQTNKRKSGNQYYEMLLAMFFTTYTGARDGYKVVETMVMQSVYETDDVQTKRISSDFIQLNTFNNFCLL